MCRYFKLRRPRIEWFEYIDWGKTAGRTYEDGRIHLVHPENWKRGRIYFSERKWIQMIYHEMGHFLLWSDPERKADLFSRRMIIGLRVSTRRAAVALAHPRRNLEHAPLRKSRPQASPAYRDRAKIATDYSRRSRRVTTRKSRRAA